MNKGPVRQTSVDTASGRHAQSVTGSEQVRPRGVRDLFNRFKPRPSSGRPDPLTRFRPPSPSSLARRYTRRQLVLLPPLVGALVATSLLLTRQQEQPEQLLLSEVIAAIDAGQVSGGSVDDTTGTVTITYRDGTEATADYPVNYGAELADRMIARGLDFGADAADPNPLWQRVLLTMLPMVFVGAILVILLRGKIGVGAFARGRGSEVDVPETRFAHVAGADGAVEELAEVVEFLRTPERFTRAGATAPKGVLLAGPPGTGKTLLARALAGEAGVPFFALSGSDFVETFVGVGAGRVRKVFDRAKAKGRAIIFIDEIDAIGKARGSGPSNGASEERENTLNQLLVEMDGFTGSGVIVLGATNRADVLDPALTRPGRFDRTVHVGLPDRMGRTAILEVHTASRHLADDVDLVGLARRTPGMSGADLEQLVNQAAMEAARHEAERIDDRHFDTALAITVLGRERRSAVTTDRDRLITAHHEAGHALAALLQDHAEDPVSVTIVPRGGAGGVTWMGGNDNAYLTKREALARLVVSMAGRAAEERLLDGDFTHGAAGDFQSATRLATQMVTEYGMSDLGVAAVNPERIWGEEGSAVSAEVRRILDEALAGARALVAQHAALLDRMVDGLLTDETLSLVDMHRLRAEVAAGAAAG